MVITLLPQLNLQGTHIFMSLEILFSYKSRSNIIWAKNTPIDCMVMSCNWVSLWRSRRTIADIREVGVKTRRDIFFPRILKQNCRLHVFHIIIHGPRYYSNSDLYRIFCTIAKYNQRSHTKLLWICCRSHGDSSSLCIHNFSTSKRVIKSAKELTICLHLPTSLPSTGELSLLSFGGLVYIEMRRQTNFSMLLGDTREVRG